MNCYHLEIPARVESLDDVAEFVQRVCQALNPPGLPGEFCRDIGLVVIEAVTNAIRHAAQDEDDLIVVTIEVAEEAIHLRVLDHGPGFDLDAVSRPDLDQPAEGGYGIFIMRSLMDEVRYERGAEGNQLVMVKRLLRAP